MSGRKTVRFHTRSSAPSAVSGTTLGRYSYYFTTGTYAGYWLPMAPGIGAAAS